MSEENSSKPKKPQPSSGIGAIVYKNQSISQADFEWARAQGILPSEGLTFDEYSENSLKQIGARKFTAERQAKYLDHLMRYGQNNIACAAAGIHPKTVWQHAKDDLQFASDRELAMQMYDAAVEATITGQALTGNVELKQDKDGNVIGFRRTFETRIRELMLKKANPAYQETQKSEVAVTGGAVIVPPPTDVEDWQATVAKWTGKPTVETSGETVPEPKLGSGDAK